MCYHLSRDDSNIVKAVAICAMLFHHLFYEHPEYGEVVFTIAQISKICVSIFVFLSGYGLTVQANACNEGTCLKKRSVHSIFILLWKRFVKFYTNYWVIFFVSILFGTSVFGRSLLDAYGNDGSIVGHFFVDFFGFAGYSSYNATWWFNGIILALWLLFPFLYWSIKSKIVCPFLLIILLFDPGNILYLLNIIIGGLHFCIIPFVMGILFAVDANKISKVINRLRQSIVFVCSIFLLIALLYIKGKVDWPFHYAAWLDSFIVVLIAICVILSRQRIKKFFAGFVLVGKYSMNMYLTHTFFYYYFFSEFIYGFRNPILIFIVLFVFSLLTSFSAEFLKHRVRFYVLQEKLCNAPTFYHSFLPIKK